MKTLLASVKCTALLVITLHLSLYPVEVLGIDTNIDNQRAACNGPDKKWDEELNSCITTPEAVELKASSDECATATNPQDCYLKNAESKTGVYSGDRFQENNAEMVAKVVAGAYSIFTIVSSLAARGAARQAQGKDTETTSCVSKTIFRVTSLAWIGGDFYLKHIAKKKFEGLSEEYEKVATNEEIKADGGSYQAQVQAFNYLREEQEGIKDQAKKRKMLQVGVIAGYLAAAGFAAYETFSPSGIAKACKDTGTERDFEQSQQATAEPPTAGEPVADGAASGEELASSFFGRQVFKLGSSPQILVAGVGMVAITGYLGYHADKEQSRAKQNIQDIDDILATYQQYMAGYCPDGREDLNKERCYCYNEDGSKNDNRTKSVICQNLYAKDDINYALKSKELPNLAAGPRQGCITVTGQFDLDCKCRNMINNVSKQNACAKAPNSALISGGFGTQLGAPDTMKNLNNITQGASNGLATLNSAALNKQAAKNKKILGSLIDKAKSEGAKTPVLGDIEKAFTQMAAKEGEKVLKRNPAFSPIAQSGSLARPASLKSALEKAEKKVNLSPSLTASAAVAAVGAQKKGNGFKFNWNDSAAREGNKVQNFMAKKYDYKDNDIVKRNDVSLWNVISKRYQTSGLKRLFSEDGDE